MRILVASADLGLRGQVALALGGERFEVSTASDTDEAVAHIAESPPEVLLADLELQGAGALALARTLRGQHETGAVRTLVLAAPGASVPTDAPGVDGVVVAPFTTLTLLRKVDTALEG